MTATTTRQRRMATMTPSTSNVPGTPARPAPTYPSETRTTPAAYDAAHGDVIAARASATNSKRLEYTLSRARLCGDLDTRDDRSWGEESLSRCHGRGSIGRRWSSAAFGWR